MIDEYWTWIFYGYHSDELTRGSEKKIVAVCDDCGKYRLLNMQKYSDFCVSCCQKGNRNTNYGKHWADTEETKQKKSESGKGIKCSEEAKQKIAKANKGKKRSEEVRHRMSESAKTRAPISEETRIKQSKSGENRSIITEETRRRMSASGQGVSYEDWAGYTEKSRLYVTPVNQCKSVNHWFKGSHAHHITPTMVAYIPSELHRHMLHNIRNGLNMGEMNVLAIQFINGGLQIDTKEIFK